MVGPEWAGSPVLLAFGTMENPLAYVPDPSWSLSPLLGQGRVFSGQHSPAQPLATWAHILLDT